MSIQDYAFFAREAEEQQQRKIDRINKAKFKRGDTVRNLGQENNNKIGIVQDIKILNDEFGEPIFYYSIKYPEFDFTIPTEGEYLVYHITNENTQKLTIKLDDVEVSFKLTMELKDYNAWIKQGLKYAHNYTTNREAEGVKMKEKNM